jgi:hypothetical protein
MRLSQKPVIRRLTQDSRKTDIRFQGIAGQARNDKRKLYCTRS